MTKEEHSPWTYFIGPIVTLHPFSYRVELIGVHYTRAMLSDNPQQIEDTVAALLKEWATQLTEANSALSVLVESPSVNVTNALPGPDPMWDLSGPLFCLAHRFTSREE